MKIKMNDSMKPKSTACLRCRQAQHEISIYIDVATTIVILPIVYDKIFKNLFTYIVEITVPVARFFCLQRRTFKNFHVNK